MEFVTAAGIRRKAFVRHDGVSRLRDVGDRLEYVISRYQRLVGDVVDDSVPMPDFSGRVDALNSQLASVAQRLQDLIILEHEAARVDSRAGGEAASARRHAYPGGPVRALA